MSSFQHFSSCYFASEKSPVALDYSLTGMTADYLHRMEPEIQRAFKAMRELEAGAIANPDENRMVGHYWLRDLDRIPDPTLREEVRADTERVLKVVDDVVAGKIAAPSGKPFRNLLSIGIGGSALGPQLVADALGRGAADKLVPHFFDNTDPDGMARVLAKLDGQLDQTVCLVISKSGGTAETRNGMLVAEEAYRKAGLAFGEHAIAITGTGSRLDNYAKEHGWIARLPMYDWVGGRTSVMSAVGLVPAGLQGVDVKSFLAGAARMDDVTRGTTTADNPAALLALYWYHATDGRGEKDMVVLPYKDRLALFSRYLQQLVMESLGKEKDLDGKTVEQGISVYGNKGSTDQHAYVQQLRDGVNNFFVVFIEVLKDGGNHSFEVEDQVTAGDYLSGFYQGTRKALYDKGRMSATLTIGDVTAETLGALIALFERAVGFYATLVNVNAYHQPGVEAGKKAAAEIIDTQKKLLNFAKEKPGYKGNAAAWAKETGTDAEAVFITLRHLAKNGRGISMQGRRPDTADFSAG